MRNESKRIVRQCLKGDRKAQRELYDRLAPKLMGICARYMPTREDAEDVLMEAFVNIFTKMGTYRGNTMRELETWCKAVVIDRAITKLKARWALKRNAPTVDMDSVFDDPPSAPIETSLDADWVMSIMEKMPKKPRLVFNMREIDGYGYEEMSEMLGMSVGSLKVNYHRARKWLLERLEADDRKADMVH